MKYIVLTIINIYIYGIVQIIWYYIDNMVLYGIIQGIPGILYGTIYNRKYYRYLHGTILELVLLYYTKATSMVLIECVKLYIRTGSYLVLYVYIYTYIVDTILLEHVF